MTFIKHKKQLISKLIKRKIKLCIAESITGGKLAYEFIKNKGASNYFEYSVVTYSNQAKESILKIGKKIENNGVISAEVAESLAQNVRKYSRSKKILSLSCTGLASKSDKNETHKVGTVFICIIFGRKRKIKKKFFGNRTRTQIINETIKEIIIEANSML